MSGYATSATTRQRTVDGLRMIAVTVRFLSADITEAGYFGEVAEWLIRASSGMEKFAAELLGESPPRPVEKKADDRGGQHLAVASTSRLLKTSSNAADAPSPSGRDRLKRERDALYACRRGDGGVYALDLPAWARNPLLRETRIGTIAELAVLSDDELLSIDGIGRKGLSAIRHALDHFDGGLETPVGDDRGLRVVV